jgi:hypothetical protein
MEFLNFDISDCINKNVDVVITSETSKTTLSTELNTITIEVYNLNKKQIVDQLLTQLRRIRQPGLSVLEFQTKIELGLTIEIDCDKLTQKINNALQSAGCDTRVIQKP